MINYYLDFLNYYFLLFNIIQKFNLGVKKKLINRIFRKKLGKKLYTNKYINKSGQIQKDLIENQVNLIKRKINSHFTAEINLDYINEFRTNMYLSLSNPKDEVLQIRSIDKIMNDGSIIKDLVEEGYNNYKKY